MNKLQPPTHRQILDCFPPAAAVRHIKQPAPPQKRVCPDLWVILEAFVTCSPLDSSASLSHSIPTINRQTAFLFRMTQQHLLFHSRDRATIHPNDLALSLLSLRIILQYQRDDMAARDPDILDGFPAVVSPGGLGDYSPSGNSHLKQPYSPCTTQAPSPAITDYNSGVIAGYYSPGKTSRDRVETSAPAAFPGSSQNQGEGPDRGVSPQEAQRDQCQQQRCCPEVLQQRMQGLWPSLATEYDSYDDCDFQQTTSDPTAPGVVGSQSSTSQDRSDRSSVWGLAPSFHTLPEPDNHRLYYPSRLDLCSPAERAQPTSTSYSTVMEDLNRCYQSTGSNYAGFPPETSSCQYQTAADGLPTTSLSPCSTTLAGAPIVMGQEDKPPLSDLDLDLDASMDYDAGLYDTEDVLGSRSSAEPSGGKSDEPYAQLIYKAFMSRHDRSMTLQEIYQWFRENTDKTKSEGKGWQNSIRHNLSMNGVRRLPILEFTEVVFVGVS